MVDVLVTLTELLLVVLFFWLLLTLYRLTAKENELDPEKQSEKDVFPGALSYAKTESLTGAQIFAGIQLLDAKRQGLEEKNLKQDWIIQGSALYFMGAAEAIAEHFQCCLSDTHEIMRFLLTRNLQLPENRAERFIINYEQHLINEEDKESSELGKRAASTWLKEKFTPDEESLIASIRLRGIA